MKIYRDFNLEAQEEEIALLHPQLGSEPSARVSADASGRHPGDERVRDFVSRFCPNLRA